MRPHFWGLFDASLGNYDFSVFEESEYSKVGQALLLLYVTLMAILMLNLLIARMSSTHDKVDSAAMDEWIYLQVDKYSTSGYQGAYCRFMSYFAFLELLQASSVQSHLISKEKPGSIMLPPPLNLVTSGVELMQAIYLGVSKSVKKTSWAGHVANIILL